MERRNFVKAGLAASILAGLPKYSLAAAKGSDKIKIGIIGCGSRGRNALTNAIDADQNIEIVAMADLYEKRISNCAATVEKHAEKYKGIKFLNVPPERRFTGFDAYKKLLEIPEIDVVFLTTSPVFRTLHIEAALNAGKHIFAEKPICIDPVQARKIRTELAPLADSKNLCVVCGTQTRYYEAYDEAVKRIKDGQIGDILGAECMRYAGKYLTGWYGDEVADLPPESVDYQMHNWLAFRWTSGDQHVEQHIHNLDICLWALGDIEPQEVIASGGRAPNLAWPKLGDRFSNMSVTYDMGNGVTLQSICRQEDKTAGLMYEKIVGTKGVVHLSFSGPQQIVDPKGKVLWAADPNKKFGQSIITEHKFLLDHVREGKHVNTMPTMVNSCLTAIAGREAAYSGMRFKYGWIKERSELSYLPDPSAIKLDGTKAVDPVPVQGEYKLT